MKSDDINFSYNIVTMKSYTDWYIISKLDESKFSNDKKVSYTIRKPVESHLNNDGNIVTVFATYAIVSSTSKEFIIIDR